MLMGTDVLQPDFDVFFFHVCLGICAVLNRPPSSSVQSTRPDLYTHISQQAELDSGAGGNGLKSIKIGLSGSLNNVKLYNRTYSLMAEIDRNHFMHWQQTACLLIYPASAIAEREKMQRGQREGSGGYN